MGICSANAITVFGKSVLGTYNTKSKQFAYYKKNSATERERIKEIILSSITHPSNGATTIKIRWAPIHACTCTMYDIIYV